jgi:hypothetical protein
MRFSKVLYFHNSETKLKNAEDYDTHNLLLNSQPQHPVQQQVKHKQKIKVSYPTFCTMLYALMLI